MSVRKILAGFAVAAVASITGCAGHAASYTPSVPLLRPAKISHGAQLGHPPRLPLTDLTDPVAVGRCIAAWVKLHDDGLTASVLTEAASPPPGKTVLKFPNAYNADLAAAGVCGTLTHAEVEYVFAQVNARTGDDYRLLANGDVR
jgi:hypothetical protein